MSTQKALNILASRNIDLSRQYLNIIIMLKITFSETALCNFYNDIQILEDFLQTCTSSSQIIKTTEVNNIPIIKIQFHKRKIIFN